MCASSVAGADRSGSAVRAPHKGARGIAALSGGALGPRVIRAGRLAPRLTGVRTLRGRSDVRWLEVADSRSSAISLSVAVEMLDSWKHRTRLLKREVHALYFAARDP